jgi:ligand-binding sensor domain-containing protein
MAVPLTTYRIQGQTSGGAAIVTKNITIANGGGVIYSTSTGVNIYIDDANALKLLEDVLNVPFLGN